MVNIVTVEPDTVHTVVVAEVKTIAWDDVDVADRATVLLPRS
jgi:hypothetical protein